MPGRPSQASRVRGRVNFKRSRRLRLSSNTKSSTRQANDSKIQDDLRHRIRQRVISSNHRRPAVDDASTNLTLTYLQQQVTDLQLQLAKQTAINKFRHTMSTLQQAADINQNQQVSRRGVMEATPYCGHHKIYGHRTEDCRKLHNSTRRPEPSYCDFHNLEGHSTEDCRARKKSIVIKDEQKTP